MQLSQNVGKVWATGESNTVLGSINSLIKIKTEIKVEPASNNAREEDVVTVHGEYINGNC